MKKIFFSILISLSFIPVFASEKSWEYVDKYSWSGVDLQSNPHTFGNLQGDTYDYKLILTISPSASNQLVYMYCNNDDTSSNYRSYVMNGNVSTASAGVSDLDNTFRLAGIGDTSSVYPPLVEIDILGTSGFERMFHLSGSQYFSSTSYIVQRSGFWKNIADEITRISIETSTTTASSGEIYLFRRQKDSIYNASDWKLIEEVEFISTDLEANPITFSNLQGDEDEEYKIESEVDTLTGGTIARLSLRFNGDTGANYTVQTLNNDNGTLGASSGAASAIDLVTTNGASFSTCFIDARSGQYRSVISSEGSVRTATIVQNERASWWENTADEITSLTINNPNILNTMTGRIRLYKRSKDRSTASFEKLIYDYDVGILKGWTDNNATLSDQNDSLVAYWKAEDTSEEINSHTLTNTNATFTAGKHNNAFTLSGNNQYLSSVTSSDFDLRSSHFTISTWVKTTDTSAASIIHCGAGSGASNTNYSIYFNADGTVGLAVSNGSSYFIAIASTTAVNDNTYHHILGTYDGTTYRIYIDGTSENSSTASGTMNNSTFKINLAYNLSGNTTECWGGQMDEPCIWNGYSADSTFIDALYKSTSGRFFNSAVDFSTGEVFKNLDTNKIYRIESQTMVGGTNNAFQFLQFNEDTGTNYEYQMVEGTGSTVNASYTTGQSRFVINSTYGDYPSKFTGLVFPKVSGSYRPMVSTYSISTATTFARRLLGSWWTNTADDLESFTMLSNVTTPIKGKIKIWEIPIPEN